MSEWTSGRLRTFIVSGLRAAYRRFPPKFETLKESYVGKQVNEKTGRTGSHYRCNECSGIFPASEVEVDHIIPVVDPVAGFTSWDDYIDRLFCKKENLQVLCETCHDKKTAEERKTKNANSKKSNKK